MKASAQKKSPDSDDEQQQQPTETPTPAPPAAALQDPSKTKPEGPPVISKKAAAFLVVAPGDDSDDSSDDDAAANERSASGETRGHMTQRHKREMKALKEQVKRLGKKGKAEAVKLETEVLTRHAAELASLAAPAAANTAESIALADSLYSATLGCDDGEGEGEQRVKKITKAQRRREQLAQKHAEREARIAAEVADLGETERVAEEKALKRLLAPLGLGVKDIPPDGHCLYRSLEHQLCCLPDKGCAVLAAADCVCEGGDAPISFLALRQVAAQHMRENGDHFKHFVGDGDAAGADGDEVDPFEAYCAGVESSAAWGGHVEIEALSRALKLHIQVFRAGQDGVLEMGAEFGEPTVQVCYLQHAYGLGEHYNSVMKREKRVTFEGEDESEDESEEEEEEE